MCQTSASLSADIYSQSTLFGTEARGAPRTNSDQIRQTLAESTLRTGAIITKEASDMEQETDRPLEYGQIGQRALVVAMYPGG